MSVKPGRSLMRFVLVLIGLTLAHGVLATALPLSGDEAYYWDCSRNLDWSYFDQPPLAIWSMVPFRLVFGETRLAVRSPALLASLLTGLFLLPLVRRLGGDEDDATLAYLLLHAMPLFAIGSFYASTDVLMMSAYVGATWAIVAICQGEVRAWWGLGVALGLGFLAKFPVVLVLPALLPVLLRAPLRRQLRSVHPYLAGLTAALLTAPVWIWAARHEWANILFQLAGRHHRGGLTLKYLGEFLAASLALATPLLLIAMAIAWARRWRDPDPGWRAALLAIMMPLATFALVALRTRVGAHWGGPGLVLGAVPLILTPFRFRRALIIWGSVLGVSLTTLALGIVAMPEALVDAEWSYQGRSHRINTRKLAAAIGNDELLSGVRAARRPGELVASESYSTVHLLGFWSHGELETRLAHVKPGKHGLASLYWHSPDQLVGRDVLFVTEKQQVDERLIEVFADVQELPPIVVRRNGEVVRSIRLLRCSDLRKPEGTFTRLKDQGRH
jgi:4-amino-4-deoxy-L-arabinose transferase-like glycosyltransferase